MNDKIFDFVVNSVRKETEEKYKDRRVEEGKLFMGYGSFYVEKPIQDLIEPCKKLAEHHRKKEKEYTTKLTRAEKELRNKGVTVDVRDPSSGAFIGAIGSGAVCSGTIRTTGGLPAPKFEAKIDQDLLGKVEMAKSKMLEHRDKAVKYERLSRAFACASPDQVVRLSIDEINFFKLGE